MKLDGYRVTLLGLGQHGGGVAAARYCAQSGAVVTVTDLAEASMLAVSLAQLADVPIARFTLGRHRAEDFRSADAVVVNPAVRPQNQFVQLARQAGALITSETELFLEACPALVVGVTGTVGKSTTAAMLAEILQAAGRRAWLGGNIGQSLLPALAGIESSDIVVLELSSFQLHWLGEKTRWPRAAVVTNCCPNHLDWHETWEHYVAAKQRLLRHVPADGFAILNAGDPEVANWKSALRHPSTISTPWLLPLAPQLKVPGEHNRFDAACAAAAAEKLGANGQAIQQALANFAGLPHRLALVGEIAGRRIYNDSKSTTPAATLAALKSMDRPTWLLLGGADKNIDFTPLLKVVVREAAGAATCGSNGPTLRQLAGELDSSFPCHGGHSLPEALRWCWENSKPGHAILLSPACPSTDQFRDFSHRGEEFERLVKLLAKN